MNLIILQFTARELGTEHGFQTLISEKLQSHGITLN